MKILNAVLIVVIAFLSSLSDAKTVLTLNNYMGQVGGQNMNYKADVLQMKAFESRAAEASADFMPLLTGGLTYVDDKKLQTISFGNETVSENANVGVQTKLRTGTLVNLGYSWVFQGAYGISPALAQQFGPISSLGQYTTGPSLMVTQPLWRDFNAALSKASEEALRASYRLQYFQSRFAADQIRFNAETAYWKVAVYRMILGLDRDSLDRTDKILKRNQKRVAMNVADKSDVLQSQAALKAKQLQYQTDVEILREAMSQFNSLRNVPGDVVTEDLEGLDPYVEKASGEELKRVGERADVVIAAENATTQKAQAKVTSQKYAPDVSVFGGVQFNGQDPTLATSMGNSWNADHPTYTAGFKMSIPLDWGLVRRTNEGYEASARAAEELAARAKFDLDQDWVDLHKRFADAVSRLKIARELESLQSEKLQHERVRFAAGRSTSFVVLQFEDNFSDAQMARLRIESELIALRAQARLYNGEAL